MRHRSDVAEEQRWMNIYESGPILVPLVHLLLALGVSIHVLMSRREAGSGSVDRERRTSDDPGRETDFR